MILLLILFLSTAQVWGQNLQYFPCDTCPSIEVPKKFDPDANMKVRGARPSRNDTNSTTWKVTYYHQRFTISDVDRYLRECYADSSTELTLSADKKAWVKNEKELAHFLWTHRDGPVWAREVHHREPTFDDFKKWLRKR